LQEDNVPRPNFAKSTLEMAKSQSATFRVPNLQFSQYLTLCFPFASPTPVLARPRFRQQTQARRHYSVACSSADLPCAARAGRRCARCAAACGTSVQGGHRARITGGLSHACELSRTWLLLALLAWCWCSGASSTRTGRHDSTNPSHGHRNCRPTCM
jgi:hypothetical protein